MKYLFNHILKIIIEIIFPEFCIGCNKLNTLLCSRCFEKLEYVQFKINDKGRANYLDTISCCCYYHGLAKKIIHELKYKSVVNVGLIVAQIMYYSCTLPKCDLVSYIPMHQKKIGKRGFNQSKIIAIELARLLNLPIAKLLIKSKNTQSQMSLKSIKDRQMNIIDSIKLNAKVKKETVCKYKSILLIDDVFTSGTTLNYSAKVLKEFGFKHIHAACFLLRN